MPQGDQPRLHRLHEPGLRQGPAQEPQAGRAGLTIVATTADLDGLAGWVVDVIDSIGALGVGLLVALETVFPPLPSEIILTFAGFSASLGDLDLRDAWVAATIGSLVGAWMLYGVGAVVGYDRVHELAGKRWFPLFGASDLERGERFFGQHGSKVVFVGRFIPLVRSIVSVPAGIDRMPLIRFSILTAVGSGSWNAVFIGLGYQLGEQWDVVEQWMQPLTYLVVALLGAGLVWLIVRKVRGTGA